MKTTMMAFDNLLKARFIADATIDPDKTKERMKLAMRSARERGINVYTDELIDKIAEILHTRHDKKSLHRYLLVNSPNYVPYEVWY